MVDVQRPPDETRASSASFHRRVVPLANLSGDLAQDYSAGRGDREPEATELSRIRDSFVIARYTAFTYKGKSVDAKDVGKELGVRYVLEGSVQRDQNRVRVNAQLIDAASGASLWADRLEEDMADLFKLQDQVVARLALSTLGYELVKAKRGGKRLPRQDQPAIDLTTAGPILCCGGSLPRRSTMTPREPFSRRRSRSSLMMPMRWRERHSPIGPRIVYGWTNPETNYEARDIRFRRPGHRAGSGQHAGILGESKFHLVDSRRGNEGLGVAEAGLAINPNFAPLSRPKAWPEE